MSSPRAFPESAIFVLGTQRSGTTWLANIFDASPDTLLFMEPFSAPYGMFPEFPGPWEFLEGSTPALDRLLREAMPERVMQRKHLLGPASLHDPARFRRERWLARRLQRFAPPALRRRLRQFELLNLNRLDDTLPLVAKNPAPSFAAIKELRLAGKIPALRHALPDARYVVIVRHPCATVHSILEQFERGGLGELRADLEGFLDALASQPLAREYRTEIARCRDAGLGHTVALYWRVSYETMVRQLEGDAHAHLLVYEALASRPRETAVALFDRLGIPWTEDIDRYLAHSTRAASAPASAIDTRRDSAAHSLAWLTKVPAELREAVTEMTADSFLMPRFAPYYDATDLAQQARR